MAITKNGETKYVGQVLCEIERYWMDGMLEVTAVVWNKDDHKAEYIQVGYYGSDCCNLCGCTWEVDFTREIVRDLLKTIKIGAYDAYCRTVQAAKTKIEKGAKAEVIKGRKVAKGTKLDIFWVGQRATYMAQRYNYIKDTEEIAGGFDENGNKVYIKTEYLKRLDKIESPCAAERKKFIKAYVKKTARDVYKINVR